MTDKQKGLQPSSWAHLFRDYSGQEWAIDYDDGCYVLFFKGDIWRQTSHWTHDAMRQLHALPINPRDYADTQSKQPNN